MIGIVACGFAIIILRLVEPALADRTLSIHSAIDDIAIHGVFDVTGHLLTALMVAIALRSLRLAIPVWAVLLGGVFIDIGHVMLILDVSDPIAGSSRNGTHSVVVVVLLTLLGFFDRLHANVWLAIALGALSHLWRDMGTGTVPFVWPITSEVWGMSYFGYFVGLLSVTLAILVSGALLEIYTDAHTSKASESTSTHPEQSEEATGSK